MEKRKLTDPLLKMTPVVVLQRLPTGLDVRSSWRKLPASEQLIAQSSCTSIPMSLPFYRRRQQATASLPEEQSVVTQTKKVQKATRRTKSSSCSIPAKKPAKEHVVKEHPVATQGSENGIAAAEKTTNSNVQEESNVCDIVLQDRSSLRNIDNEETTSTKDSVPSPVDTLVLTEHSGRTSASGSDTEIDESAAYDTSLSHDSNDTIAVTVPADLLTDLETDTDVESRNTAPDADSSLCHSQESSQSEVLSDSEKHGIVEEQTLHSSDIGKKSCATNADPVCSDEETESDTRMKDSITCRNLRVDFSSPEPAPTALLTARRKQISAEDEIDAFTANIIETMLDVHPSSLPTFVEEYFHHFKVCLEVLRSMQEADKNLYARVLCRKRDPLRRIFQLFKEMRHLVDYTPLESVLALERQFSNFLTAAEVSEACGAEWRAYLNSSSEHFSRKLNEVEAQRNAVADCPQAQSRECRGAIPSSAAGSMSSVTPLTSARQIPQSTAQPRCDSSTLHRAGTCATQSPFPPRFSPCSEPSRQNIAQSGSPVARYTATHGTHDVQSMTSTVACSVYQRQQPQAASVEQSASPAMLHASTNSSAQGSSHQPQTTSLLTGSSQRPFTLVVRGVNSLSQATEAARKIVLNQMNCTTTTQTRLPQCSSPATRTQSSAASSTSHNVLCQAKCATDFGGNPNRTFTSVPVAPLQQGVPLRTQPAQVQMHAFSVQPRAPVAVNGASPIVPPVRWTPQGLLFVPSQRQTTNCSTGFMSSAGPLLPSSLGQSCVRNSWPRPNVSNFALVLPPLGTVNQQLRSSVINIEAPVTVMPAGQAVMHSGGGAIGAQDRNVPIGGFNGGPLAPPISQPRPCITGVVIPVVRSRPEGNVAQNVICTVQDASSNGASLVPQGNAQNSKPHSVETYSPLTPHLAMGPSR
ncbi:uncharacterized protein LOC135371144 isoform X2 [Ornithodoros turicata]